MWRRWKWWNWFTKIFPIYSGQSRKLLDASWLEDQAIGTWTGTSQQSFLPCLSAVFIVHRYLLTGTPLHNLVITLVQQISYFPCLLNKDIDKSWWPSDDLQMTLQWPCGVLLMPSKEKVFMITICKLIVSTICK